MMNQYIPDYPDSLTDALEMIEDELDEAKDYDTEFMKGMCQGLRFAQIVLMHLKQNIEKE